MNITVYDPWANPTVTRHEYGVNIINELPVDKFNAVIMAVAHREFNELDVSLLLNAKHVIYDVKSVMDKTIIDGRL